MTTLFTAIAYLWLVLTILLVAMWILREQDRRRRDQQASVLEEELLAGRSTFDDDPLDEPEALDAQPDEVAADPDVEDDEVEADDEDDADHEFAGEADAEDEADPEDDADADTPPADDAEAADDSEPAPRADPLPWQASKRTKRPKIDNRRKPKQPRSRRQAGQSADTTTDTPAGDTPPPPSQTAPAADPDSTPRILAALDGVSLPFDLTPLTARIVDPDSHVILISPHGDAAEVGTAFADELVEQGFTIEAAGFDQALATRDGETISMRISPDAGTISDGGHQRYPSANKTDVAIELWLGNGSPPPLAD